MPRAALLLSIALIVGLLHSSDAAVIEINAVGSRWASYNIGQWLFAYEQIRPNVQWTFAGANSAETLAAMQAGTIDWGAYLATLSQPLRDAGYRQFAFTVPQTIMTYSLGGLIPDNSLNLTANAICGIWAGQITRWDDPEIINVNPQLAAIQSLIAGKNITVFYRSDSTPGTSIFTGLMAQLQCPQWKAVYGNTSATNTFAAWPLSIVSKFPNFVGVAQTIGVCGAVVATNFSVSFAEQSWAVQNFPLLNAVRMQGRDGDFVSPYDTTGTSAAISRLVFDNVTNTANAANLPGANVYPFISLCYILLNTSWPASECSKQREVLKFFRWALTEDEATTIQIGAGAVTLLPDQRKRTLDQLFGLECGGERLLRIIDLPQHHGAGFPVLLALSMFLWAVSLVGVGAAWWIGSRSKNPLFYAACLGLGTSLAFASLIFFYIIPREDWVCQLRQWFLALGLSLLFGVMFARGWQLHVLHTQRDSQTVGKKDIISTSRLAMIIGIVVGVQFIILICWSAIDKLHSARVYSNAIDLESRFICRSKTTVLWLVLELAYFVGLLGWGMYVVYRTWKSRAAVDSRWTLIAIYNTLMVIFVIIPLLATVAKTDDWVFYVAVLGTDFAIVSAVGSIYGSVLLRRIWDRVSGSGSGSGSKEGKVSTFRASMSGEGTIA